MRKHYGVMIWVGMLLMAVTPALHANPSFARQTGLACNVCHTTPPELTTFGRLFKLNGYTLTSLKGVTVPTSKSQAALSFPTSIPIGMLFSVADTFTQKTVPGAQNNAIELPAELSFYYGGAITAHLGGFSQITYDHSDDHFSLDMTDFRYARSGTLGSTPVIWGLDVNNGPGMEDLWNTGPVWGFPWTGPEDSAPGPAAGPIIGELMGDVAGGGAYAMINNTWFANVDFYRSDHAGGELPLSGQGFDVNIRGLAPYWRVAWDHGSGTNDLEIGSYGIYVSSNPDGIAGLADTFFDPAVDFQYQHALGTNSVSVHGTAIFERSQLRNAFAAGDAAVTKHTLNYWRADATYHVADKITFTGGYSSTTGTSDALMFAPDPVDGSANGDPASAGFVGQVGYWPHQNVLTLLQYTAYTKFNGGTTNYDGSGRNAHDNNTLYAGIYLYF